MMKLEAFLNSTLKAMFEDLDVYCRASLRVGKGSVSLRAFAPVEEILCGDMVGMVQEVGEQAEGLLVMPIEAAIFLGGSMMLLPKERLDELMHGHELDQESTITVHEVGNLLTGTLGRVTRDETHYQHDIRLKSILLKPDADTRVPFSHAPGVCFRVTLRADRSHSFPCQLFLPEQMLRSLFPGDPVWESEAGGVTVREAKEPEAGGAPANWSGQAPAATPARGAPAGGWQETPAGGPPPGWGPPAGAPFGWGPPAGAPPGWGPTNSAPSGWGPTTGGPPGWGPTTGAPPGWGPTTGGPPGWGPTTGGPPGWGPPGGGMATGWGSPPPGTPPGWGAPPAGAGPTGWGNSYPPSSFHPTGHPDGHPEPGSAPGDSSHLPHEAAPSRQALATLLADQNYSASPVSLRGLHVLVIDDSWVARRTLAQALMPLGCIIHDARDAEAATHVMDTRRIDLILLDLMLPGESGMSFLNRLRESGVTSAIPVVVISGVSTSENVVQAIRAGASFFLVKPVNERYLQKILNGVMRQYMTSLLKSNVAG